MSVMQHWGSTTHSCRLFLRILSWSYLRRQMSAVTQRCDTRTGEHEEFTDSSSTSLAWPSFSGRMWSTWAMGRQPSVLLMNSMSSRSTSRTTRIFALACGQGPLEVSVHAKVCASVLQSSCHNACSMQKGVICNKSMARARVWHHSASIVLLQG